MNNTPLYVRIENALSSGRWMSLDEILVAVKSSSKSYVKMTLFAMPNVQSRAIETTRPNAPKGTWRWEFRLIESVP